MKRNLTLAYGAATLVLGSAIALSIAMAPPPTAPRGDPVELEIAKIYWEYNSSANDLGVHVSLDGEDWKALKIIRPGNKVIFEVRGRGAYQELGMTELFFEGAEPSLDEFPLAGLLAKFPEGEYDFEGVTVDNQLIEGEAQFTHAIPAGPHVSTVQGANDFLRIDWTDVTAPPAGFPNRPIVIAGYQVIVGENFQVTLPGSANSCTVSPEFVASLAPGEQKFEVLAIEAGGNQTITEGTFIK